jgi:hypothetical protein
VRFDDITGLIHCWQRTSVVGINNFKKQGVYVRGGVQSDHALQTNSAIVLLSVQQVEGTQSIYSYGE